MSRFSFLRSTLKEIIDLSKRSDILADQKSKVFCQYYLSLKNEVEIVNSTKIPLMKTLCEDYGLKSDKIYSKV